MRCEAWEPILHEHIRAHQGVAFEWGKADCCLFVAIFVDAVTGTTHTKDWHGRYSTEQEAQEFMESRGFSCPSDITDTFLTRKPVSLASRGDIVSFEGGAIGICAGRYSYFFVDGKGLSALPTLKCKDAWEV